MTRPHLAVYWAWSVTEIHAFGMQMVEAPDFRLLGGESEAEMVK
jgi:hypothetical protein